MPETATHVTNNDFAKRLQAALHGAKNGSSSPNAAPAASANDPEVRQAVRQQETQAASGVGPVGAGEHVVRTGECISSIAKGAGHFWETIWNEPANVELRDRRKAPNILLSGDRVTVPPLRDKIEHGATQARHRFVRRGEPAFLRLRLMDGDEPRANVPFVLQVDEEEVRGVTDPQGNLEAPIPGNARHGTLRVGDEGQEQTFAVNLGQIDPITELSGVQGRLNNLGFGCGPADGQLGPQTRSALSRFQEANELKVNGEPDEATRAKLLEAHGS